MHGERGSAGPLGPLAGAPAALALGSTWAAATAGTPGGPPVSAVGVSRKPRPCAAGVGRAQVGPCWAGFAFSFLEGIRNRLLILFLDGSMVNIIKSHRYPKIVKLILLGS